MAIWWLAPAALIAARIVWQRTPGLAACALFWGLATVFLILGWEPGIAQLAFAAGVSCNASVTLANGGFMPVASHRRMQGPARSVWVQKEGGTRLTFLADNFGNNSIRFSIGDVLLLAGFILSFLGV
jgi:hypothetical protein